MLKELQVVSVGRLSICRIAGGTRVLDEASHDLRVLKASISRKDIRLLSTARCMGTP